MKLFYKLFSLFIGFSFLLFSCDNEPIIDRYEGSLPENSNFQVDIGTDQFFFANSYGLLTEEDGISQIVGKTTDGRRIHIFYEGHGEGTYTLEGTTISNAFYYDGQSNIPYSIQNPDSLGTLKISKYDLDQGVASGSFSLDLYRKEIADTLRIEKDSVWIDSIYTIPGGSLKLHNGEFTNIPLNSFLDMTPPENSVNSFEVKLDNATYVGSSYLARFTEAGNLEIRTSNGKDQLIIEVFKPDERRFNIEDGEARVLYYPDHKSNDFEVLYKAISGRVSIVQINENDKTVSGTFAGLLENTSDGDQILMNDGYYKELPFSTFEDDEGELPEKENLLSAEIGSYQFSATSFDAQEIEDGDLKYTTADENGNTVEIILPKNINTGKYQVEKEGRFSVYIGLIDENTGTKVDYTPFSKSGEFTITENLDNSISGEFNLTVRNSDGQTIQVTGGEFVLNTTL